MTRIIALVALVVLGGIIGAFAYSQLSGEASAAPGCPPKCATPTPVPQQREDQVTIFADGGSMTGDKAVIPQGGTYQWLTPGHFIALDPSEYPPNATFRFEIFLSGDNNSQTDRCVQLEVNLPGQGSEDKGEICTTGNVGGRLRSDSFTFTLPPGELQIGVEARTTGVYGTWLALGVVSAARIIAEWTE